MKLAAVSPSAPNILRLSGDRDYHLTLSHIADRDPFYRDFYKELAGVGRHVILDNGTAEEERMSGRELYDLACEMAPTELVLPDVVGEPEATFEDSAQFLRDYGDPLWSLGLDFVYVLQCSEFSDLAKAVDDVGRLHLPVRTLAVPKFYTRDVGPRIEAVHYLLEVCSLLDEGFNIHLLGLWDDPYEFLHIERSYPGKVRGCDTSWPFIAAWAEVDVCSQREGRTVNLESLALASNPYRIEQNIEVLGWLASGGPRDAS